MVIIMRDLKKMQYSQTSEYRDLLGELKIPGIERFRAVETRCTGLTVVTGPRPFSGAPKRVWAQNYLDFQKF